MVIKEEFEKYGFEKEEDIFFQYRKDLISKEVIESNDLNEEDIPCLLFGSTELNKGFCINAGGLFIWLNSTTVKDAVEFANKIVSFEEV